MASGDPDASPAERTWWISIGLGTSAVSAAASSFDGLRQLASAAGWSWWMAPALPATVDALAITATGIWIGGIATPKNVRSFARTCAVVAIGMSIMGNAAWHLLAAHLIPVNWILILGVGTLPPIVLGFVSHLAALRRVAGTAATPPAPPEPVVLPQSNLLAQSTEQIIVARESEDGPPSMSAPVSTPTPRRARSAPTPASDDDFLARARSAAAGYESRYRKPITRDALRRKLQISSDRATELLRQLRAENDSQSTEDGGVARKDGSKVSEGSVAVGSADEP